jgi:uncharacterized protein YcbK (DUF882 family)
MRELDGCFVWTKGEVYPINKYFNTKEFTCHCSHPECIEQKIDKELVSKLTDLRVLVNEPMVITSGFRCAAYQKDVEASGQSTVVAQHSQHELGKAVDCKTTRMPIKNFVQLAERTFKAIGIASTWCHLDLRDDKERRWYY